MDVDPGEEDVLVAGEGVVLLDVVVVARLWTQVDTSLEKELSC